MPACVKSSFDLTCVWRGAMSVLDALPRSTAGRLQGRGLLARVMYSGHWTDAWTDGHLFNICVLVSDVCPVVGSAPLPRSGKKSPFTVRFTDAAQNDKRRTLQVSTK